MIKLTLTEKGGETRALTFDKDEVSIGRVSGNDIVLPKGNVSKRHSKLVLRDGRIEIVDLKSTNGTYVNGRKIADPMLLTGADKIYVGDFMIVLEREEAAASAYAEAQAEAGASGSRRAPAPPSRGGSNLAQLPEGEAGSAAEEDDDESLGLALRPPRAGRMPPPPPPPPSPRRTPLGNPLEALDDDAGDAAVAAEPDDLEPPLPSEIDDEGNETSAVSGSALFAHAPTRNDDVENESETGSEDFKSSPVTANRHPGALLAEMVAPEPSSRAPSSLGRALSEGLAPERARAAGPTSVDATTEARAEARALEGLEALLADPAVSAILMTGPETTLIERGGKLEPLEAPLGDANAVADAIWRVANAAVPPPAPDNPVVDVRLLDGTRVTAVFPPAAPAGVCATFRKPALPERTLADLGPEGTMSKDLAALLEALLAAQRNVIVTGDAAAVAATLGALGAAIPAGRRVVSLGTGLARGRTGWTELAPAGDVAALVRVAASFRPEHIVVGEAAGPEVLDLLLAAARGQEGIAFGLPARTPSEALVRLDALAARNPGASGSGIAPLTAGTIDAVVHAVSMADGGVRIVEVAEIKADAGDRLLLDAASVWRGEGARRNGGGGKAQAQGASPRLAAALAAAGSPLPPSLVRK